MGRALVAGVGMTPFSKPSAGQTYTDMAERALRDALVDSGLEFADLQQAYASYVYGTTSCGQSILQLFGSTGIPIVNLNNSCASASTALFLARQLVEAGGADCVLALGFEQMPAGPVTGPEMSDMVNPMQRFEDKVAEFSQEGAHLPLSFRCFGAAAQKLQADYGITDETFAKVVVKARRHAADNPRAIFRDQVTVEQVLSSPRLIGPLTRLQACPPTRGAAAAILVSERFAAKRGISPKVAIRAQAMHSDFDDIPSATSPMALLGEQIITRAANEVYEKAGVGPDEVKVAEIHDCFSVNELVVYSSLGFTKLQDLEAFVSDDQNTYGGKVVINPSGGLLSKGHPLGATGLAQCAEITWQLRGECGTRQVEQARFGLAQNSGVGSTGVVTLYERV